MADRNLAPYSKFDLSSGGNTALIHELSGHASDLRARFEKVRSSFEAKLGTEEGRESLRWTAHDQRSQHKLYEEAEKARAAYDKAESAQRSLRDRVAEAEQRLHKAALERISSVEWDEASLTETTGEDGKEDERQREEVDDQGCSVDDSEEVEYENSTIRGADSEDESGENLEESSEDGDESEGEDEYEYFSE